VAAANVSVVRAPGELRRVLVTDLTAFTLYSVTVTAFTGPLEGAARDGKASRPVVIRTQEEGEEGGGRTARLQHIHYDKGIINECVCVLHAFNARRGGEVKNHPMQSCGL